MDNKLFEVPEETLNEVLGYLGDRPYKEVSHIIAKIYSTATQVPNLNNALNKEKEK